MVPEYKDLKVSYGGIYPPTMISNEKWIKDNIVLIGDACHGLHPGRSQGMNTSIKSIDSLIENLPSKDKFQSKEIFKSLKSYEISVKPMIDDILDKNHKIGLGIDKFDKEIMKKEINLYKQIQQNNDSSYKYRMNSAGYGTK